MKIGVFLIADKILSVEISGIPWSCRPVLKAIKSKATGIIANPASPPINVYQVVFFVGWDLRMVFSVNTPTIKKAVTIAAISFVSSTGSQKRVYTPTPRAKNLSQRGAGRGVEVRSICFIRKEGRVRLRSTPSY